MKRMLCLYRVSTKGQVDKKDDIPMQQRERMAFIERMEDWYCYDELKDAGVLKVRDHLCLVITYGNTAMRLEQ